MKPFFIKCSLGSFKYRQDQRVVNNPVNLSLCTSIYKSKFAWYPDNEGKPAISFSGCNVEWAYNDETSRDTDFEKIACNLHNTTGDSAK